MANFTEVELQKYTKAELIYYMMHIQSTISPYKEPIRELILSKRYEDVQRLIEKNLEQQIDLSEQYEKSQDFKILEKKIDLNNKLRKLWSKEKRIEEELYGD